MATISMKKLIVTKYIKFQKKDFKIEKKLYVDIFK